MARTANHLNLFKSDLDKAIYRILPVHRLLECIEKKSLVLVEPSKWDDPFENLLLKGIIKLGTIDDEVNKLFRSHIYGQCWTFHRETDAMWRIYSTDKQGVKVKSTISNLIGSLTSSSTERNREACYIGKVKYLYQKDLVEKLSGITDTRGRNAALSLLYKRKEFSHEKEVRLIYTRVGNANNMHSFNIEPNDLFEEIVFDPRMNDHLFRAYKDALISSGFKNPIRKSVMYQLPRNLLERI